MGSTVALVIDTSRQSSCQHPMDAGSERLSSISSSSTKHCTPSSSHTPSSASTNVSAPSSASEEKTDSEGLMWQIEEYLSHFDVGRATTKARRPAKLRIEIYPETIEHALASSPDALRFSATPEHDLLSPFYFNLQGERLEEDAAPFPYSPDGEGGADHLERRPLPRRLDGERQDQNDDDGMRECFQTTMDSLSCNETAMQGSLDPLPPSTKIFQDLRKATKLKKLLGDEVDPHLPMSLVRTKPQQHPVHRRRSQTAKPLPLIPRHHLHRSDTSVTMPELVHLGNRAMLGSYKPRDKLRRLDGQR